MAFLGDGRVDIFMAPTNGVGAVHLQDNATGADSSFFPFGNSFAGGVRVAVGDVNGDGLPELIAGAGPGGGPLVAVFDAQTSAPLQSFFAFAPDFAGGVNVAAGDVNGDGRADIIIGTASGSSQVKVFDGLTGAILQNFFAFSPAFAGGVFVAAMDQDGDGRDEIVVGAGPGGTPQVRVLDGLTLTEKASFLAFDSSFTGGVTVASGDTTGDGRDDLIVGTAHSGSAVKIFDGTDLHLVKSFFAFDSSFTGGVNVAVGDWNADGDADLIVGAASFIPLVNIYDGKSTSAIDSFVADFDSTNGAFVAVGDISGSPIAVAGTSGADLFHPQGDGTNPIPGKHDVPYTPGGNHIITPGGGDDLVIGGPTTDQVNLGFLLVDGYYTDFPSSLITYNAVEGTDTFRGIERFHYINGDVIERSPDGQPRSTTVSLVDPSSLWLRHGGSGVLSIAINETDPLSSSAEDPIWIQQGGRVTLNLADGGNSVLVDVTQHDLGLDQLVVNGGTGRDELAVKVADLDVSEVEIKPLDDFAIHIFFWAATGLPTPQFLAGNVQHVAVESDADEFVVHGNFDSTGLDSNTIELTGGASSNLMDASGVTSNHRVVMSGRGGADTLRGGAGADVLEGGSAGDTFVFDHQALMQAKLATPLVDLVSDYDQGNSGLYSVAEGDQIDLSAILATAFGAGQAVSSLVRIVEDPGLHSSRLQVDADGTAGGVQWTTIAHLQGIHTSHTADVTLSGGAPGVTVGVQASIGNYIDFGGGGQADLLWRSDAGGLAIWNMAGGSVTSANDLGIIDSSWTIFGTGDFNGDGKGDMVWRHEGGALALWMMDGGSVGAVADLGIISSAWDIIGVGDFNGDGKSDLLWRDANGFTALWLMDGGSVTAVGSLGAVDPSWHVIGLADVNGDNRSDMIWRDDSGFLAIWQMDSGAVSAVHALGTISNNWHIVGSGDFNADSKADLIWRNDAGALVLWEMNGGSVTAVHDLGLIGDNWHIAGVGDFNGDGKDDLMWNSDAGAAAVWLMNGGTVAGVGDLGTIGQNWSTINHHYDFV